MKAKGFILWSGPFIAAFRKWWQDVKYADAENKVCKPNIDDLT
jgi:hypothetical protein